MFTTVFCAILDTETGELRFSNAGHNPPLVLDSQGVRYLRLKPGVVLGPLPDSVYQTEGMKLQPGDVLFLYTDGVTEAKNRQEELYGEPRLLEAVTQGPKARLADMVHFIRAEVVRHADGAQQSDDVTMLAIKYLGAATNADKK